MHESDESVSLKSDKTTPFCFVYCDILRYISLASYFFVRFIPVQVQYSTVRTKLANYMFLHSKRDMQRWQLSH